MRRSLQSSFRLWPKTGYANPLALAVGVWLTLISLGGCTGAAQPAPIPTEAPLVEAAQLPVLNIYNWDTYIDPAILTDFEKKFQVKTNYQIFGDNEELLENLKANSTAYDLIVPSDYMVTIMRREGLLAPLNKDHIPNFKNIDPLFINSALDPGNRYCAPYQWGTTGIGYNLKATGREITSWNDIFDPVFAGRVTLLDASRDMLGLTLLALGYSPNSTNRTEITSAGDFLKEHAKQIAAYTGDNGQDLLAEGKVEMVVEYSGDIFQIMEDHPNIRYVIPQEGALLWSDNMCIPANAPHKELAEQFINYILAPEVGAQLSNFTHYSTPNLAALPLINEADRYNPSLYPSAEIRNRLYFAVDLGPEMTQFYEEVWEDILASHKP